MLATDLADVLRAGGVKVVETDGWKTRSHRPFAAIKGILCHHTAGPKNATGTPSLHVVINGRPDVSGPLCNIYLQANGTAYIIAAGRANHAGKGQFFGITDGGSNLLGVEAENAGDGKDVWEAEQMDAYARICAATAKHYGFPAFMVRGHKEWAMPRGRKIDPTFDMDDFREVVETLMGGGALPTAVPQTVDPARAMLRKGSTGQSVVLLQQKLAVHGGSVHLLVDGNFGPKTEAAVKAFQSVNGLTVDGIVGLRTWAALLA